MSKNKFMAGAITAAMVATAVAPVAGAEVNTNAGSYIDVSVENDHYDNIYKAQELGFMRGNTDGTFEPAKPLSRSNVVKTLARYVAEQAGETVETYDVSGVEPFSDVPSTIVDKELYNSSLIVKKAKIFSGDSNKLNPLNDISRQQMAKVLVNAFGLKDLPNKESKVTDNNEALAEYVAAINILSENGVTVPAKFMPKSNTTRAQFASFVVRAYEASTPVAVTPEVASVSAINAKQLQVTFKTAMDADSVEDVTNFAIKRAGVASRSLTDNGGLYDASASLSADGKTVTLTLDNALTNVAWGPVTEGDTFNVEIDELTAADGQKVKEQTIAVKYSDKVAPTFVSAAASGKATTNRVVVTFSEPVDTSVATATVNGSMVTISAGSTPNSVVLTSGSNLNVNTSYNVSLLNFKDFAGNLLSPNPVNTTVTVSSDTVAPVASSVEVVRDNLLKVTFDKAMDASTVTASTVKLLDANLATTGITQGLVTAVPNTGNKSFYVPLSAVPFNASGNFSGTVVLSDSIKDAAGNALTSSTKSVTISKDVVAPQVASISYKNSTTYGGQTNANGFVVIKFNETVNASAAAGAYTLVDNKTGAVLSTPTAVTASTLDATELVISLAAPVAAGSTTYTVVTPSSAAVDKSLSANPSTAANLTVNVSAGAPVASDVVAPVVNSATETASTLAAGVYTPSKIVVNITDAATSSGIDAATVLNVNNYRIDGLPLPAGSYVTFNSATGNATINFPLASFATDKNYTLNVYNIKDMAGYTTTPFIDTVTFKDDIKPEMSAATLNTNGTLSTTFSEAVVSGVGKEADFVLSVNNSANFNTGANRAFTIADGVGSDAGKYVITVATLVEEANGTTIANDTLYIDVDGSQNFNTGDIVVSQVADATVTAGNNFTAGNYNLNNATSVKIATKAAPTLVTDTSDLKNAVKGSKAITVK